MPDVKKTAVIASTNPVEVKYIFSDNYNPVYVNGAWGGVSPHGEIVAHFYLERHALPLKEVVDTEQVIIDPPNCNRKFVRMIENGIIMDLNTAKDILNWLQDKIAFLESRSSEVDENGERNEK